MLVKSIDQHLWKKEAHLLSFQEFNVNIGTTFMTPQKYGASAIKHLA